MITSYFSELLCSWHQKAGRVGRHAQRHWRKYCLASAVAFTQFAALAVDRPHTFANPINIDYRFMLDAPSRREAADPLIVVFGDDYYLFASKSGGYWHSTDMLDWARVPKV